MFELCKKVFDRHDIKDILLRSNLHGETVFHWSLWANNAEIFQSVKCAYEQIFEQEEMIRIVLANVGNRNILRYCVSCTDFYKSNCDLKNMQGFFAYLKDLFVGSESLSSLKEMFLSKEGLKELWWERFREILQLVEEVFPEGLTIEK